jgi:energy-coupling factor transport system ATP-binding protein
MKKLEIRNLSFEYKENTKTLDDVSFSASMGEFICILGHNGSGKSTLAKLIMGLLKPTSGEILIDGVILNEETVEDLRGKLGIVFQNPDNQFVGITVKDDIAFGLENRNVNRDEMLKLIDKYARIVGMENFLDRNPESLSGGEKQRVAIAGALASNPKILIFDEATSMLDPKGVSEVLTTIKALKGMKTIIYITHNLNEALLADKLIVMNKGNIILSGTKEEVFKEKEILKSASLDILDELKLIELIENNGLKNQKEFEEFLWQLTYQM